ncbi:MAG: enoyl-CoA hydratase/isomerase family protein [Candidatus Nezhaarchaeales archaeon]
MYNHDLRCLNAINDEVLRELNEGLDEAERSPDVIAVVITRSGEKAFSAGADIEFFKSPDIEQVKGFVELGHKTILRVMEHPKPVIAAINGVALGGGCENIVLNEDWD